MTESQGALRMRLNVATEVRTLAARHRYTQEMVGQLLGLKQSAISRRFKGEVAFDVDELEMLAQTWDVPITDLFGPVPRPRQGDAGQST